MKHIDQKKLLAIIEKSLAKSVEDLRTEALPPEATELELNDFLFQRIVRDLEAAGLLSRPAPNQPRAS